MVVPSVFYFSVSLFLPPFQLFEHVLIFHFIFYIVFFTVSLYSIFNVCSIDYNIHTQLFTVYSESIFYYFKLKNISTL